MTTQEIRNKKREFRKQYRDIRNGIGLGERIAKNHCLHSNILSSMSYRYSKALLLFYSVKDEPDTIPIAEAALADGKKVYFPKCYDGGILKFYRVNNLNELTETRYGIPEPTEDAEEYVPCGSAELCIVPGLCFDRDGYRLGYGKGYYDRFLSKFKGISMGIAFTECITDEKLPYEKRYDKPVNLIVTEKEVMCIG